MPGIVLAALSLAVMRPLSAGFDAGRPSVWLAEGLLQYLSAGTERALFKRIHDLSAPGSHLVVERTANLAALFAGDNGRRLREINERAGIAMDRLVDTEARQDPAAWLVERGWTVTEHPAAIIAERYHRRPQEPRASPPERFPCRRAGFPARRRAARHLIPVRTALIRGGTRGPRAGEGGAAPSWPRQHARADRVAANRSMVELVQGRPWLPVTA